MEIDMDSNRKTHNKSSQRRKRTSTNQIDRDIFVDEINDMVLDIDAPHFGSIIKEVEKFHVFVPANYDEGGLQEAIEVLGQIQQYRDVLIALKLVMTDKRNYLRDIWDTAKNTMVTKDPEISSMATEKKKEAACKLLFQDLFQKFQRTEDNVKGIQEFIDNAISKFNTCSRQIAVLEMQISLGEIESKRRR